METISRCVDDKPANLDNRQAATSEIPSSGAPVFHGYLAEVFVAVDQPLGWLTLTKGRHILSFLCVGKDGRSSGYNLGINDVVLERVPEGPEAQAEALPIPRGRSRARAQRRCIAASRCRATSANWGAHPKPAGPRSCEPSAPLVRTPPRQ